MVIWLIRQCKTYSEASKLFSDPKNCQSCLTEVVKLIEESTHVKTNRAKCLCDCVIPNVITSEPILELEESQEIIEIPYSVFMKIVRNFDYGIVGSYHPRTGRIFLLEDEWCFSNLVHETLHSRSAFSKIEVPPKNLEFVYDGLTELLVGLVLRRKIPCCYSMWQFVNSCFLSPYEKYVRTWYYLTLKVDFKRIMSLYFNMKEDYPIQKLGELLQDLLDKEFENIFLGYDPKKRGLFDRFKDQLGKNFPMDFASFQNSQRRFKLDHLDHL